MEINNDVAEFASWIADILRVEFEESEDSFIFSSAGRMKEVQLSIAKEKLQNEIDRLAEYEAVSETVISTGKNYEILVREEGSYFKFSPRSGADDTVLSVEDNENGLRYSLGRPSNAFALYLIQKAASYGEPRALSRPIMNSSMIQRAIEEKPCILDFIKKFIAGRLTLKIDSTSKISTNEFDKYSSAFLFNISYNTDTALVQQRDFDELLRSGRITRTRRFNMDELDPPRRTYIPDLVHHYQLAVGTENPMLEYISYYHIAEHFFEDVFTDALVEKVRNKITHADFSYKRKKDISSLIKDIGNSIKIRDESMTFNEQEGLKLTLKKYIDLKDLAEKLNSYDETLINYYKQHPVSFSGANTVDIESEDGELIFKQLSARIY